MKINNKGYASTIIMFSILTLFLISMLMLVKTMNNSSSLNKKITEKVVDNIDYDASGTVQDQILELKTTITSMQNQIDNIKGEVINEIYPVGSIYMSTEDDSIEKVQSKFGGTWEKYAQGRTLIGDGVLTNSNGNIITYKIGENGGNLNVSNINLDHTHVYDKTSSGSYSTVINHKHSTNSFTITRANLPSDTIIFGDVKNYNHKTNNSAHFSTGVWGYYGGTSAEAIPIYMTNYDWGKSISIGDTSAVGTSSGSISLKYDRVNTGNMSTNNKINAQDPYIVIFIYKRVK